MIMMAVFERDKSIGETVGVEAVLRRSWRFLKIGMITLHAMKTNRDFYLAIVSMLKAQKDQRLPALEVYLGNLLWHIAAYADREGLALDEFFHALKVSFDIDVPRPEREFVAAAEGFVDCRKLIEQQIQDLREMGEQGVLDDEYKFFGVDAPSGERWYNFDPCSYIECATCGSLGGWEDGDESGRQYVPGEVAVLGEDGKVTLSDPREIDNPIVEIPLLAWEVLKGFILCGQIYE